MMHGVGRDLQCGGDPARMFTIDEYLRNIGIRFPDRYPKRLAIRHVRVPVALPVAGCRVENEVFGVAVSVGALIRPAIGA